MSATTITVRHRSEGWHRWPDAPPLRSYLATSHRHLFHVEVTARVDHDERDIEFHDLRDEVVACAPSGDMGAASCEAMARRMLDRLTDVFDGKVIAVEVWEDGECGARVEL